MPAQITNQSISALQRLLNPAFRSKVFAGTLVPLRPTTLSNFNPAMSEHDI